MKKTIGKPHVVAQSAKEQLIGGGYQDPLIRCRDGKLYLRFSARMDNFSTFGKEDGNPLFTSSDMGETWVRSFDLDDWIRAASPLGNGDRLQMCEYSTIYDFPALPKVDDDRRNISYCCGKRTVYTVDELVPYLGDRIAKEFVSKRIKNGESMPGNEKCKVVWKNMDVSCFDAFDPPFIKRHFGMQYYTDKNGVLWMPLSGGYVKDDGKMGSRRACISLLRSDDNGHTWNYTGTVAYKEEYNIPSAKDVEGFLEAAVLFADNGDIVLIMRSGSLCPYDIGDKDHPAPKMYSARSSDGGKTWKEPEVFHDYGVFPRAVQLGCGAALMTSGRPGVYVRASYDKDLYEWEDVTPILTVPEDEIYTGYFRYSCANNDLCVFDANTAFLAYSDFTMNDENGDRAKSIVVRKITFEP